MMHDDSTFILCEERDWGSDDELGCSVAAVYIHHTGLDSEGPGTTSGIH